jgi:hypothetical protein
MYKKLFMPSMLNDFHIPIDEWGHWMFTDEKGSSTGL